VVLIHLLEILGNESLGRYASKPKLRVQRFENANIALDYITSKGIQMANIGAEDIVDGNQKLLLGLVWTLILRFTIAEINEEGMTAKEGLLLWCQRKTACYQGVEVRDFSGSWNDGLAFCALLDIHRPDLIDYEKLDKSDHRGNMQLAFTIASREIGIPELLDVEDVCDVAKPDERSLMTYIAYWFHAFSAMERVENAGRRVEKFVTTIQGSWDMQSSYEKRMRELLRQIFQQQEAWSAATFDGTYADAREQSNQFNAYKKNKKREWVSEKADLVNLLGNIKTKMTTYKLKPYIPPPHLRIEVLDTEWTKLLQAERARTQLVNDTIREIKKTLQRSFADKANDFALALSTISAAISGLEGDLQDQLTHCRRLKENIPPLEQYLSSLSTLSAACEAAHIEENDYTIYTYEELSYELSLVQAGVSKKLAFLENQIVAAQVTNLTPVQLEEFESVFRHFDRDLTNSLTEIEFSAALASLGLVYDEKEMHEIFLAVASSRASSSMSVAAASAPSGNNRRSVINLDRKVAVSFEGFLAFMVDVTQDDNSPEQVFQSFRDVAEGKEYITEVDLRMSLVPEDVIARLTQTMPLVENGVNSSNGAGTAPPTPVAGGTEASPGLEGSINGTTGSSDHNQTAPVAAEERHYDYVRFMKDFASAGVDVNSRPGSSRSRAESIVGALRR
jgi:hypothetical protein